MRKRQFSELGSSGCDTTILKIVDAVPPLRDCSEVYRAGVRAVDFYQLDTSGGKNITDDRDVYCGDGWTEILRRKPYKTYYREVQCWTKRLVVATIELETLTLIS